MNVNSEETNRIAEKYGKQELSQKYQKTSQRIEDELQSSL